MRNILKNFRSQLELVRKEKMTFIANINVQNIRANKNYIVTNDETHCDFKYTWLAGTCLIVGDSILIGVNKNRLSKNNQTVQV